MNETKEHIIGELYMKQYELYRAHQFLLDDKKSLEEKIKTLQSEKKTLEDLLLTFEQQNYSEVALAHPPIKAPVAV
jgi:hypothetical protein